MQALVSERTFTAAPAKLGQVPLLVGLEGPPGGGKTYSALRLATGMRKVRPGPVVVIDTEAGRAAKYAREFDFLHVRFEPPYKPTDFLSAVRQQLALKPAAVIVDSISDEHEGEGGVLDWHDQEVERFRGNEHAAWSRPKADRKRMLSGFLRINTPLIFTFRAREKTKQVVNGGKKEVVSIGYQPIAPAEILFALDLVCLLPNKSDGVPVWKSEKAGEDFLIKLPNYLRSCIVDGALDEQTGERLARFAMGTGADPEDEERDATLAAIKQLLVATCKTTDEKASALGRTFGGVRKWNLVESMPIDELTDGLNRLRAESKQTA